MKKFKTMMAMMLALVSMCVAFSSCSSDDDDNSGAGCATAEIVGTTLVTPGLLDMTVMGDSSPYGDATFISWKKLMIATVKITLPAFG